MPAEWDLRRGGRFAGRKRGTRFAGRLARALAALITACSGRSPRGLSHAIILVAVLGSTFPTFAPPPDPPARAEPTPLASIPDVPREPIERPTVDLAPRPPFALAPADVPSPTPQPAQRPALLDYAVQEGDSLRAIAARFGVSVETLVAANELLDPDRLSIGQPLVIPSVDGAVHRVRPGDSVASIAATYSVDVSAILAANGIEPPYIILPDQRLVVPGGRLPPPRPVVQPAEPPSQVAAAAGDQQPVPAAAPAAEPALPPPPANATAVQREFIALLAPIARATRRETGIPASVTVAVAIHESYWGTSRLARDANNYFGIKAMGRPGTAGTITLPTWEVIGGRSVSVADTFRAYESVADSVADFARLLSSTERYAPAMRQAADPRRFVAAVAAAGYATDPAYAGKIVALMDRYDLYRYDQP